MADYPGTEGDDRIAPSTYPGGRDTLEGRGGDDLILLGNIGLRGDADGIQIATGGSGADRFVVFPGSYARNGIDRILDFNPGEGDRLEIYGVANGRSSSFHGLPFPAYGTLLFGGAAGLIAADFVPGTFGGIGGTPGDDALYDGNGDDGLQGGDGDDVLGDGAGDDALYGRDGDDSLNDTAGSNRLYGGDGNDTLQAGAAGDRAGINIDGGAGDDVLMLFVGSGDSIDGVQVATGGTGADRFVVTSASRGSTVDGIADFDGAEGDRLSVPDAIFHGMLAPNLFAFGATLPGDGLGTSVPLAWYVRADGVTSGATT